MAIPSDPTPIPSALPATLTEPLLHAPRPAQRFVATQASVLLDVVRSLAAIFVMLGHWRNLFFVDYGQISRRRVLFAIPYTATSGGHQEVIIFFVLSGFLISGSVFRMFNKNAWSWKTYLLHRIVRLWIVLIPGLLLAALCDFIGLHLHRQSAVDLYAGLSGNHLVGPVRDSFHLSIWFANLFFLQGSYMPTFGSDGALWSLANEFWYYLLFPLGFLALRKSTPLPRRAAYAIAFLALLVGVKLAIAMLFFVWLLGTLMAALPPPRVASRWLWIATTFYIPVLLAFAKAVTTHTILADLLFGLITFGFLRLLLAANAPADERSRATRFWRTFARFSYTLYLVHMPMLILLSGLTLGPTRWQPDLIHLLLATAFLLLVTAAAYGLATLTEFRTDSVRRYIERHIERHMERHMERHIERRLP